MQPVLALPRTSTPVRNGPARIADTWRRQVGFSLGQGMTSYEADKIGGDKLHVAESDLGACIRPDCILL